MFSSNTSQVSEDRLYVEDVFSTFVYTGNGGTQTITNGIDLAGKGGLVWIKARSVSPAQSHFLCDTARGSEYRLASDTTDAQTNSLGSQYLTGFNSNGFGLDGRIQVNGSTYTYASWTFRKAPKFFDVVTYTGNGSTAIRAINHNLGVAPGMIIVKRLDQASQWKVTHFNPSAKYGRLNSTDDMSSSNFANLNGGYIVGFATETQFNVAEFSGVSDTNANGGTYVAYLFAHDATSDGIIQCGSFTTNSTAQMSVTLGWEPQWVLVKRTDATSNWQVYDVMRGMSLSSYNLLYAENSLAESVNTGTGGEGLIPTSTGISSTGQISSSLAANATYIYIAIRRGPMRTPTTGTSVFSPNAYSTTSSNFAVTTNFPVDLSIGRPRTVVEGGLPFVIDRLRGTRTTSAQSLTTSSTDAESSLPSAGFGYDRNTGYVDNISVPIGYSGQNNIYYNFRRAPSFMDVVCYTGTGSEPRTVNHNLGVAPELMIVKARSSAISWVVYAAPLGSTKHLILNSNGAESNSSTLWYSTTPTSTLFTLGDGGAVNGSGSTYVAYLFASCPGVSKIGTYTGNGSSQTINCGFAGGARFVLIKRTDSTGNWLVGDSARGIVAGNDPLLYLNSTAAEVTTLDWIDADSSGFIVNQDSTANANVNGASYIYLAIS